jgi:hypothetical protein
MSQPDKTLVVLRRLLLGLMGLGLLGLGGELIFLNHYDDLWQILPLILIATALAAFAWHLVRQNVASVRVLQTIMALFVAAGALGIVLHFRASMEFQLESGATPRGWPLFLKVLHAKVPPALAPGAMAQLGLLGLVYTYCHSALSRSLPSESPST